jgi:hypothetical protein
MKQKKYNLSSVNGQIMLWLTTIPEDELSDTMRVAKKKFDNDIDFIEYIENNLSDEVEEFVQWNVSMTYRV